jgi:hypothetical protein
MIRTFSILFFSIIGGILSAMVFSGTVDPSTGWKALELPAVLPIAVVFGGVVGLGVSPLMIWALDKKNLWIAVPGVYALAFAAIIILNLLGIRFSEWIAVGITVLGLLIYRFFGRRVRATIHTDEIGSHKTQ